MSVEIKLKNKKEKIVETEDISSEICDADDINKLYSKKCGNNKEL